MKILIIDNNIDPAWWGAEDLIRISRSVPDSTIFVRRGPQRDLPSLYKFDRIVISGSLQSAFSDETWVKEQAELIRECFKRKHPLLGVCFGHQLIGRALGGIEYLKQSPTAQFGWFEVKKTGESKLLNQLPETFYTFESHYEEVRSAPEGFLVTASSELCPVEAFEHQSSPIYGIQFHPEKSIKNAERIYQEQLELDEGGSFQRYKDGNKLYDSSIADTILQNFCSKELK